MFAAAACLLIAGCNTYDVKPLKYDPSLKDVVLVRNPSLQNDDLFDVLGEGFRSHGFNVIVESASREPKVGECKVTFDAIHKWDFASYVVDARVWVRRGTEVLGEGHYHHIGEGNSMDYLTKWRSNSSKMKPLFEELLKEYSR